MALSQQGLSAGYSKQGDHSVCSLHSAQGMLASEIPALLTRHQGEAFAFVYPPPRFLLPAPIMCSLQIPFLSCSLFGVMGSHPGVLEVTPGYRGSFSVSVRSWGTAQAFCMQNLSQCWTPSLGTEAFSSVTV